MALLPFCDYVQSIEAIKYETGKVVMTLDFMKPDSGEVKIFGHQMNEACKNQIGYLPEERGWDRLSSLSSPSFTIQS